MTELLRWEDRGDGNHAGFTGIVLIALIVPDRQAYGWAIMGVRIGGSTKSMGHHNTVAGAKKEVERRWVKWLEYAGLAHTPSALDKMALPSVVQPA